MDEPIPAVEFQEEKSLPMMAPQRATGMYAFIISLGIAQNEQQAQNILIGIAGVIFLIAFAAPFFITGGAKYTTPDSQQIQKALRSVENVKKAPLQNQ